jgi:hypothetical protein
MVDRFVRFEFKNFVVCVMVAASSRNIHGTKVATESHPTTCRSFPFSAEIGPDRPDHAELVSS